MNFMDIVKGTAHIAVTAISAVAGTKVYTMAKAAGFDETKSIIVGSAVGAFTIYETNSIIGDIFSADSSESIHEMGKDDEYEPKSIIICPICGHGNNEDAKFCSSCGCPLGEDANDTEWTADLVPQPEPELQDEVGDEIPEDDEREEPPKRPAHGSRNDRLFGENWRTGGDNDTDEEEEG